MMKIRDLNLSKKLERHHLSHWMMGFAAIVTYGLYKLKSKGNTNGSVHLIHKHVAITDFVVGAMTFDMEYSLYRKFWAKLKPPKRRYCLVLVGGACFS